jgi:hypothetical protein
MELARKWLQKKTSSEGHVLRRGLWGLYCAENCGDVRREVPMSLAKYVLTMLKTSGHKNMSSPAHRNVKNFAPALSCFLINLLLFHHSKMFAQTTYVLFSPCKIDRAHQPCVLPETGSRKAHGKLSYVTAQHVEERGGTARKMVQHWAMV